VRSFRVSFRVLSYVTEPIIGAVAHPNHTVIPAKAGIRCRCTDRPARCALHSTNDLVVQIIPVRIAFFNQLHFPFAVPSLDLFLA
jgi:hypothetical protein